MCRRVNLIGTVLVAVAAGAAAQTTVTNGNNGTAGTVPMYTGAATLGNSPLTFDSNGNLWSKSSSLDIDGVYPNAGLWVSASTATTQTGGLVIEDAPGDWLWGDHAGDLLILGWQQINFSANPSGSATVQMSITGAGNVGVGTANPGATPPTGYVTGTPILEVNGDVVLTPNSGGSITFQDGTTQSTAYTGVVCGGDYAESMDVSDDRMQYGPGDILVLDPKHPGKVLKPIEPYSSAVSGVYSTKPGTVGRRQLTPKSETEVPMAMVGVVPTKVTVENGAISVGDLLVSSSKPGYAMKGTDRSRMLGAVIGKAMGSLDSGTGLIEVLVTLQ